MTWGFVGAAAVAAVGAGVSASQANKAAGQQASNAATGRALGAAADYRATQGKYLQMSQDFKALEEQNTMNLVRQGYRAGLMQVQKGLAKQQAVQQGYDIGRQKQALLGSVTANTAAAGATGASAEAVANDIRMQSEQATIDNSQNYAQYLENYNAEVGAMALQNETEIVRPRSIITTGDLAAPVDYTMGLTPSYTNPWAAAAVAGVGSAAGNFIGQYTKLNAGAQRPVGSTQSFGPAPSMSYTGSGYGQLGSGTFGMNKPLW